MLRTWLGAGAVLTVMLAGCREPKGACDTDADCGAGQICDPTANLCFATETPFGSFEFLAPQASEGALKSGPVKLRARLVPVPSPDTTLNYPGTVAYKITKGGSVVSEGTLTHAGDGLYEGDWTAPQGEESYELTLSHAELTATKTFRTDNTKPKFTVTVPPATVTPATGTTTYADPQLPSAWRRDQVVEVSVTADEAVAAGTMKLVVHGINAGTAAQEFPVTASSTCAEKFCGVASVDLAKPTMNAFRGSFSLEVRGADLAGNDGAVSNAGAIPVTRWKWAFDTRAGQVQASPAIAGDGVVVVGTRLSSSTGSVVAINPDGRQKWINLALGAVVGSPSIGAASAGSRIYLGVTAGTGGTLYALSLVDGAPSADSCPTSSARYEGSPALLLTQAGGQTLETAVAVANATGGGSGVLSSLRVGGGANQCATRAAAQNVLFPSGIVAEANNVYYSDTAGAVRGYSFRDENWEARQGWPVVTGYSTRALAIANSMIVASGVGGPGEGGFVTLALSGGAPSVFEAGTEGWNPSVASSGTALVGLGDGNLLRTQVSQVGNSTRILSIGISKGAPLFGADGLVYRATDTGALEVRSRQLTMLWSEGSFGSAAAPASLDDIQGSLAIDCARPPAGGSAIVGRPGTLYVPSTNAKLYAFVVDSRGIDTTAAWPKYQHDPRNTGNADTSLSEFACP